MFPKRIGERRGVIQRAIASLIRYGVDSSLVDEADAVFTVNRLLGVLGLDEYDETAEPLPGADLETILREILAFGRSTGLVGEGTAVGDRFGTRVMGCLVPPPRVVVDAFQKLYRRSPVEATDWFYRFCQDADYIRRYRIARDIRWSVDSEYGAVELSINLAKPEKDPRDMAAASVEERFRVDGFDRVECGMVKWPLSVIRLRGREPRDIVGLAAHILEKWRWYTDETSAIFSHTDGQPHNTVTPIARRVGDDFELDLALRNNLTTPEHPLGLYHPHAEYHHIKSENIGLIEVMGLAVLPARLQAELDEVARRILAGGDLRASPLTEKHADWAEELLSRHSNPGGDSIRELLLLEVGAVFVRVLECCGVFKRDAAGRRAFAKFLGIL